MNISRLSIQKMIAITALAMAIPMSAQAGHHEGGDKKPHSEMRRHHQGEMGMLKKLDLSDAQQTRIDQIMKQQKETMKATMADRRSQRDEMKSLVEQDAFDAAKAERLIAQQQDRERASKMSMLRTQHEIYKVLTPEQREKAKVMRAQWKEKMSERRSKNRDEAAKPL
ncbi:protein CpxP [Limnobacter thiooxidans]|uniref:Uncharacterized protein n=1 Tax=Limnobacter thiooxidans TaxID=131080 RepID=A0AA86JMM6_9BURK|nr:protein CpxP [Limnobacter thiooxidans]BET27517.1 hypothetical protein RGQ30_30180 [Limnobacter thiooxidans]